MKIVATEDVADHIRENGGQVFVWTIAMVYGFGFEGVFTLEASTTAPDGDREFLTFRGEAFDLHYDPSEHGTPEEIHLRLTGRRQPLLRAYWDGRSFASGHPRR